MITHENVGKIFKDEEGNYWRLTSYCEYPTATMEKIGTHERIGGAVGSPNLTGFHIAGQVEAAIIERAIKQCTEITEEVPRLVDEN